MNLVAALFQTSIGRKIVMAVSGFILVAFVTGHLIGNLHVFGPPDEINGYAHFLRETGPILWIARGGVLLAVALHIWAAVVLTAENLKARPSGYAFRHTIQASLASRTMRMTGLIVLFFVLYHLAHFTWGVDSDFFRGDDFKSRLPGYVMEHDFHLAGFLLVPGGTAVDDVYSMVVRGFQHPVVSGFYIIAIGLLTIHLWHGIESMFQTVGLKTGRWSAALRYLTRGFCVVYFLGNLAIPGAILLGKLQPLAPAATTAANVISR